MLLRKILIAVAVLSLFSITSVNAEVSKDFQVLIENPDFKKLKCEQRWDYFWPLAKKGDLDARLALFWLLAFRLHMDEIYPPGRSHDVVTLTRDIIILGVHSSGATYLKAEGAPDTNGLLISFLKTAGFSDPHMQGNKFYNCFIKNPTPACTQIALDEKIVPTFEDYAAEIDAAIAIGKNSTCIPFDKNH